MQKLFSMINQYNVYLLIPLFLVCYFLVIKIDAKNKKEILYGIKQSRKQKLFNKFIAEEYKLKSGMASGFLEKTRDMLYKQGCPLGLKVFSYYMVKLALFLLLFILGTINYKSLVMGVILGFAGFYAVNIYIYLNSLRRNSLIRYDLLNVVDSLYLQMSANVTLKDSLRGLHEVCKDKDLKHALIVLAGKYQLSKFNIEHAAEEFKKNFDILEIDMFAAALKQQISQGSSLEVLGNLSDILRDGYIDRLNLNTKGKVLLITLGVVIILVNIILLTFFPIFVDISSNMREIFK